MASIFDGLTSYGAKWELRDEKKMSASEQKMFSSAVVTDSEYGKSVCFHMKAGGTKYIPVSRDSELAVGDEVDPKTIRIQVLGREGDDDILRIDGEAL